MPFEGEKDMTETENKRPIPVVEHHTKPFWDGTKKGKLLIQKCDNCGQLIFFPRVICHSCLSQELGWLETKGEGSVYSFTIIRQGLNPNFLTMVPYAYAIIELDEGVRFICNIVTKNLDDIKIGSRVKVMFEKLTEDISIPLFELI